MSVTSDLYLPLMRKFEGCKLVPYRDSAGYWTIGWGHLLSHDRHEFRPPNEEWTQDRADTVLAIDADKFEVGVRSLPGAWRLKSPQVAALTDFAFNLGLRTLRASTLFTLARAGDMEGAAAEFPKWKFAGGQVLPGLIRRRAAEAEMFLCRA